MNTNTFEIGSVVEITTCHPNVYYYTYKDQPEVYNKFVGEIVKNDSWLESSYISVRTKNKNYPVSLIKISSIKDFKIVKGRLLQLKKYPVAGSKNKVYTVTQNIKHFSCSCPGFAFNGKCKHVDLVKNDVYE
jgi:hypothetical protein